MHTELYFYIYYGNTKLFLFKREFLIFNGFPKTKKQVIHTKKQKHAVE